MKKIILILSLVLMATSLYSAEKKALLVVSFGTSHPKTRKLTIEATENKIKSEFPDYDFYRAFTSNIIIKVIKKKENKKIFTVKEAFENLKAKGYTEVLIQSLHVINGAEYYDLYNEIQEYKSSFKTIHIAKPLLTTAKDYKKLVKALAKQFPKSKKKEAIVLMGHGTHHHSNSAYPALEYTLNDLGHKRVYVGTVEGYPSLDDVIKKLKKKKIKKVTLMPLMIVAGDHAKNDMAGDEEDSWKSILQKKGYKVGIYLHGLGENKAVQEIFLDHTKNALKTDKH